MGVWSKTCKVCKVKRNGTQMTSSGMGWICHDCERERNLEKRKK